MLGSSKTGTSGRSRPSRKKEGDHDADVKKILRCVLELDGPVTFKGLERAHDTITWRLESSAREIHLIAQERELGKKELLKIEAAMKRMESE